MAITKTDEKGNLVIISGTGREIGVSFRGEDAVVSVPPDGFKKVNNIYYNPDTDRLVVVYEA